MSLFRKIRSHSRLHGVSGVLYALRSRFCPSAASSFSGYGHLIADGRGIEVGGPSRIFSAKGLFPAYQIAASLDNVTFASRTIWEENDSGDRAYRFHADRPPGIRFISDATDLKDIGDCSYDFLLSSHVLEHLANPLKGLHEWIRIVRDGGVLVIAVPHKDGTFDHLRPVTELEHMISDYRRDSDESDDSHGEEVLALHDLECDEGVTGLGELETRIRNNFSERSMHHHVFCTLNMAQLLDHAGLEILSLEAIRPCHVFAVVRKVARLEAGCNKAFLDSGSELYLRSPFRTDRSLRNRMVT